MEGRTLLSLLIFSFVFVCQVYGQGYTTKAAQRTIKVWAPGFMSASSGGDGTGSPSSNPQSPEQIAANYDLLVYGAPITVRQQMMAVNPNIKLLRYVNGGFKTPGDTYPYPESAYAHTAANERITASKYSQNTLMNPLDQKRRDGLVYQCNNVLNQNYHGCFFDTVGGAPTGPNYVDPDVPVYPGTSTPWSTHDWLVAQNSSMLEVTTTVVNSSAIFIGNCLGDGLAYFNPTAPTTILYGGLSGAMMEQFLRGPTDPYTKYPGIPEFNATVNALVDAGNRGKSIYTVTKMWLPGPEYTDDKNNWHKYALATFFLGTHDKAYFNLQYSNDNSSTFQYQRWWNTYIGAPTAPHSIDINGVYSRNFALGVAIVNPTAVAATFTLPAGYQFVNLWGAAVSGSYRMNATSGDILTYTGRSTSSLSTATSSTTKASSTATTKAATTATSSATTKAATTATSSATTKAATTATSSATTKGTSTSTTKGTSTSTTKAGSTSTTKAGSTIRQTIR